MSFLDDLNERLLKLLRRQFGEEAFDGLVERFAKIQFRTDSVKRLKIYFNLRCKVEMGIPLGEALQQLWENESDWDEDSREAANPGATAAVALKVWRDAVLSASEPLSDAMSGWIPDRDRMLIRAGEASNTLDTALRVAEEMHTSEAGMQEAIFKSLAYPGAIIVLVGAVVWVFGIKLFGPLKKTMPPSAFSPELRQLMELSDFLEVAAVPLVISAGGVVVLIVTTLNVWTGRSRVWFERLPPWSLYKLWYESAFLRTLASLLRSGEGQKTALEQMMVTASPWLKERIRAIWLRVRDGDLIGDAIMKTSQRRKKGARLDDTVAFNFPRKEMGRDIKAVQNRDDIGGLIDLLTKNWVNIEVRRLNRLSQIIFYAGMVIAACIIGYMFQSIESIADSVQHMNKHTH